MEENGWMSRSTNMSKDYNNGGRPTNKAIISCRIPSTDHYSFSENNHQDMSLIGEFSWPPRFYSCTFCKREFRSAQALGGHMNVHRREKARLRQITPPRFLPFLPYNSKFLALNPNPNPNPNPNIPTCFSSSEYSLPFSVHSASSNRLAKSDRSDFLTTMRSQNADLTVDGYEGFSQHKDHLIIKKSEKGSLVKSRFDDLDLELRLGCS